MAIILKNINIDSYRGINGLQLADFNHVNILVGDNNAGKTTIMEAICALTSPLSLNMWNEIAIKKSNSTRGVEFYSAYNYLFPIDREKKIGFSGKIEGYGDVSVSMTADGYDTTIPEREMDRINGFLKTGSQKGVDSFVDTSVLEISINDGDDVLEFEVYDFQMKPPREYKKETANVKKLVNIDFIEPRDGLDNDYEYLNSLLLDIRNHDQLVEILKEFDPAINGIVMAKQSRKTECFVRTSEHVQAVPISVYGDGIKKALLIFSALAANRGGIVLIDEVETSIHTSAMKSIFKALVSWAKKLNIQLFISTHSKEAIDILLKGSGEYSEGINVYTLYRYEQKNYVRKLSCAEAVDLQDKMGLEIR